MKFHLLIESEGRTKAVFASTDIKDVVASAKETNAKGIIAAEIIPVDYSGEKPSPGILDENFKALNQGAHNEDRV